jgi:hypothetical protein
MFLHSANSTKTYCHSCGKKSNPKDAALYLTPRHVIRKLPPCL